MNEASEAYYRPLIDAQRKKDHQAIDELWESYGSGRPPRSSIASHVPPPPELRSIGEVKYHPAFRVIWRLAEELPVRQKERASEIMRLCMLLCVEIDKAEAEK